MRTGRILGAVAHSFASKENMARAWATVNGDSIPAALINSVGVSALTDNGTGDYTLTWQRAFYATEYVTAGMGKSTANNGDGAVGLSGLADGQPTSTSMRYITYTTNNDFVDLPVWHAVAIGRI